MSFRELEEIGPKLIQLSNSIGNEKAIEANCYIVKEMREILYKNNPKAL